MPISADQRESSMPETTLLKTGGGDRIGMTGTTRQVDRALHDKEMEAIINDRTVQQKSPNEYVVSNFRWWICPSLIPSLTLQRRTSRPHIFYMYFGASLLDRKQCHGSNALSILSAWISRSREVAISRSSYSAVDTFMTSKVQLVPIIPCADRVYTTSPRKIHAMQSTRSAPRRPHGKKSNA